MTLKENLKKIRVEKRISQRDLAEKSGLSYSMVSKLESGEQTNPSLDTLKKIAIVLGVNVDKLLSSTNELTPDEFAEQRAEEIAIEQAELGQEAWEALHSPFNSNDLSDILDATVDKLKDGTLMYNGRVFDEETLDLLADSLRNINKLADIAAKEKFTPKKYQKYSSE